MSVVWNWLFSEPTKTPAINTPLHEVLAKNTLAYRKKQSDIFETAVLNTYFRIKEEIIKFSQTTDSMMFTFCPVTYVESFRNLSFDEKEKALQRVTEMFLMYDKVQCQIDKESMDHVVKIQWTIEKLREVDDLSTDTDMAYSLQK